MTASAVKERPARTGTTDEFLSQQWKHFDIRQFKEKEKKEKILIFGFVERRKSLFFSAALKRFGFNIIDLGDHVYEDVTTGKEYGTRGWCNPTYFTSGAVIRKLEEIRAETGLSKEEIVNKYAFLSGGGQIGFCRYGMYPQEYYKAFNDAGYKGFPVIVFGSDSSVKQWEKGDAVRFTTNLRVNMLIGITLADAIHARDMEIRPYEKNPGETLKVVKQAEEMLYKAFLSRLYHIKVWRTLKKVKKLFDAIPVNDIPKPRIYITGEFFANHAHNAGNYHLRNFCISQGCEVNPALFTERTSYDYFRRLCELKRELQYDCKNPKKRRWIEKRLRKIWLGLRLILFFSHNYLRLIGAKGRIHDVFYLARLGEKYYNHLIFGGESNMEIAEAILAAQKYEGFISSKPFTCMPSSGVSDGIQSKIQELYPDLNFLSIETSGDNEANILNRVSMLIFKAKQLLREKQAAENPKK